MHRLRARGYRDSVLPAEGGTVYGRNLSFVVVGSICGSFLVNAAMIACGQVRELPEADAQPQADATEPVAAMLPPGLIVAYAGAQPPEGWLLCDGHPVSRSTYAALFGAVGDTWGKGDAVTTFNLPDLRGRFLRGVDAGAGRDPDAPTRVAINAGGNIGDAVGSLQGDAMQGHAHAIDQLLLVGNTDAMGVARIARSDQPSTAFRITSNALISDGVHGTPQVSNETRPQNANVTYIIKI
jgi:microcystin-dependent protein